MAKDKKGKLGGIKSTSGSDMVKRSEAVTDVKKVEKTSSLGRVKGASKVGKQRAVRALSMADREVLRTMIDEEANNLFNNTQLSKEQKDILIKAVKMAVDLGIMEEEEED